MSIKHLIAALTFFVAACAGKTTPSYPPGSILDVLAADGRFTTLLEIIEEHSLETIGRILSDLDLEVKVTVFAPTDEAFAAVPEDLMEAILADVGKSLGLVHHHIVPRPLPSSNFELLPSWRTFRVFDTVAIEVKGDEIRYDGALITETDIQATNGYIHVLVGSP